MVGGLLPVGSLKDLQDLLENGWNKIGHFADYAFYSVLLYTPTNALNKKLHEYVTNHSGYLHTQTGFNWLVFVVEDINRGYTIEKFAPEEVYYIARELGATVEHVPGLVFFTEPKKHNDTLSVKLEELLPPSHSVRDEDITKLFGKLTTIIDSCSEVTSFRRLECLREKIDREWPKDSKWRDLSARTVERVKIAAVPTATVASAIVNILNHFGRFL